MIDPFENRVQFAIAETEAELQAFFRSRWHDLIVKALSEARTKVAFNIDLLATLAGRSIDQFYDDWPSKYGRELARIGLIIERLHAALAVMSPDIEADHFQALSVARADFERQLAALHELDDEHQRADWASPTDSRARMASDRQNLIFGLCSAWFWAGDGTLALPPKNQSPTSPLLRFISTILDELIANDPPKPMTILSFIAAYAKPEICAEAIRVRISGVQP